MAVHRIVSLFTLLSLYAHYVYVLCFCIYYYYAFISQSFLLGHTVHTDSSHPLFAYYFTPQCCLISV